MNDSQFQRAPYFVVTTLSPYSVPRIQNAWSAGCRYPIDKHYKLPLIEEHMIICSTGKRS